MMKKIYYNINGGAAVRFCNQYLKTGTWLFLVFMVTIAFAPSAFAQGSIFGTVTNSDLSVPANGTVSFVGYLDNTDEEIRIETSTGAGYDAGNWFDDFQNYLTEAPGNPYDYLFFNTVNGEGFQLSNPIPNNSFQQEDIVLTPVFWPAAPIGLTGNGLSSTSMLLTWNALPGLTYHIYRRPSVSSGSFFRIDDPTGSLANPGVADSFFVDATVDGVSSYDYIIIAEDPSGNLSPHSTVTTLNSATVVAPSITTVTPSSGPASGGTTITITGSNFDLTGMTVQIGLSTPVAATVVSPYELTAVTPAGSIGLADVTVTNTNSVLASNTLLGAFTYNANTPPVLAAIGPQSTTEGVLLTFTATATDIDGDFAVMTSAALPPGATYTDNGDGTGTFNWTPLFTDAGSYNVSFYATDAIDPLLVDSELVVITVIEAGNQTPVMAAINDTTISEGTVLQINVSATDADGEIPALSATTTSLNTTFTDNLDGTGLFTFSPDLTQSGTHTVTFKAIDAALDVDSQVVTITVVETNQAPVLAAIGPQAGTENVQLQIPISATDGDGTIPVLTVANLPPGAVFNDSLNGAGLFDWTPTFTESGIYTVTFYASDGVAIDSEAVTITIADAGNQPPVLAAIGPQSVLEGGTLFFTTSATDPDGTVPLLSATGLPANAVYLVDTLNGAGIFTFTPAFDQAGTYTVTFFASDGVASDSEAVLITVTESGNQAPVFTPQADTSINEGGTLTFTVVSNDPDGGGLFPVLSINTVLNNYTFIDNADGTGTFTYNPTFFDGGIDTVVFFATDFGTPQQTASLVVEITTNEVNQAPQWATAGPYGIAIGDTLQFTVTATDSTDAITTHRLFLSTVGGLLNSTFVDNGDGTGTFIFAPDSTQVGLDTVTFLAVDQGTPQLSATMPVEINVIQENIPPILNPIGPQIVTEGNTLIVNVSATDPDGPAPQLIADKLPNNSNFVDNGNGTGVFTFFPSFVQSGLSQVVIKAFDGFAVTKEVVLIQVDDAGDQAPVFDSIPSPVIVEDTTVDFVVTAFDPDEVSIAITATPATLPSFVSFVDSGNGVSVFTASPGFNDSGLYTIEVIADDGTLLDTIYIPLTIQDAGNQLPVLGPITDQTTTELIPLSFGITYSDIDGSDFPLLSSNNLPSGATVTDNRDGTGTFDWTPTDVQAGAYNITFLLQDFDYPSDFDSQAIVVTVLDTNRTPFIITSGSRTMSEGDTLEYTVFASDPDGTIPLLGARLDADSVLGPNMTFVDSGNGVGVLTFIPDYTQGDPSSQFYFIRFYAIDAVDPALVQDATAPVQIEVQDRNAPPEIIFINGDPGPFTLVEGDSLIFSVGANDVDATLLPTISATNLPANATFNSSGSIGVFRFLPDFTQSGNYTVTFVATDDQLTVTSQDIQITVTEAGNQTPTFTVTLGDTVSVPVNQLSQILVTAFDPDFDLMTMTANPIHTNLFASFVDSGNGRGVYSVTPDQTDLGNVFEVTFAVSDPSGNADTIITNLSVVSFLRGDLDDNSKYTMNDLAWLISYLFRDGPAPQVEATMDIDNDGAVNISDATYLIRYLYFGGPPPPQ